MSEFGRFDFNIARELGSDDEIVDYLRNTAKTNINWDELKGFGTNTDIVNHLRDNSEHLKIFDKGIDQDALKADVLKESSALNPQNRSLLETTANYFEDMFGTKDAQEREAKRKSITENIEHLDLNTLNKEEAKSLYESLKLYENEGVQDIGAKFKEDFHLKKLQDFQNDKKAFSSAMQKENYSDLTKEEKEVVDSEVGSFQKFARDYVPFVDSMDKHFETFKAQQRAKEVILPEINEAFALWESNAKHILPTLGTALFGDDEKKKNQALNFLEDINKHIAEPFGFDGVAYDTEGNLYLQKGEGFYRINENFFDKEVFFNTLKASGVEIGAGVAGAIRGAQIGSRAGAWGLVAGGIAGGAVGSMAGAGGDYLINNYLLDRENSLSEFISKTTEAGLLSAVGDIALLGVSKIPAKAVTKAALKGAVGLMNNNVFVGGAKNAVFTQNIGAAQELLAKNINPTQQEAIKSFAKEFGGDLKKLNAESLQGSINTMREKFGENSILTKTAQKLNDFVVRTDKGNAQKELLETIRSDESGLGIGMLLEIAKESPAANSALKDLLQRTSANLDKELSKLGISEKTAIEVFADLKVGTKESYDEAINGILGELYRDNKVVLPANAYLNLRNALEKNIELDTNALSFLRFIENNIFNKEGVSFKQLSNARAQLNSFYEDAPSGTKDFLKNLVEKELRESINTGIEEIFKQNPQHYLSARELYQTALNDYATMSQTLKQLKKIGFDKENKTIEQAIDTLLKYAKGSGGIEQRANYALLTQGLSPQNKQALELSALQRLYKDSFVGNGEDFKVFDSKAFFNKLGDLENIFQTQGSKEYISFLRGFNTLFSNDAQIALKLGFAKPKQEGSSIATTVSGAVQQKFIKGVFATLIRNLPHNNIFVKGLGFSEKVQAAALRFHLRRALEKSKDINAFKTTLTQSAQKQGFNNATMEVITKITDDIEALHKEILGEVGKSDLLDIQKPLRMASQEELTTQLLNEVIKQDSKLWVGNFTNPKIAQKLGLDTNEPIKITMQGHSIKHTLDRHGAESVMAKNGAEAISLEDIKNHAQIINNADKSVVSINKDGQRVLISGKQINGHYIVIETISTKHNELKLKTMYKQKGNLEDNEVFRNAVQDHLVNGAESLSAKPSNHLDEAFSVSSPNSTTKPQALQTQEHISTKEILQFAKAEGLSGKETLKLLKEKEVKKTARELLKDINAKKDKELQAQLQAQEELELQKQAQIQAQKAEIQKQKDSQAGKAINEVDLQVGDSIVFKPLKQTYINTESKAYPAQYAIIDIKDLKPNFANTATQGRIYKQDSVIQDIKENLNPNKMFFNDGGFDGVPLILSDGKVSAGNHRAEALKNLSPTSREAYVKGAKEAFGVDLKDNEVIVRILDKDISKQDILNLSFASNIGREQNIAEKALSNLGKYQENLKELPDFISAQNADELSIKIAKILDKTNNGLNAFDTNLSLLASLSKTNDKSILEVLKKLQGSAEEKQALLEMFVKNAGSFHNLSKSTATPKLDLRPYLNQIIHFTNHAKGSRVENFKELLQEVKSILATTNVHGANALLEQNKYFYDDLMGKILGYSFARFKELENPSKNLFEFLSNINTLLREELEPTLFAQGRPLRDADIYDFASVSIKSGTPSNETSELLDLLPALKEKAKSFEAYRQTLNEANNPNPKANLTQEIPQDLQKAWLKEFNLKSIDEDYKVNFNPTITKILDNEGVKEVKITKGSLEKLLAENRTKYLDRIKPILLEPDRIVKQDENVFIFAKDFGEIKYFTSVVKNQQGEWIISSNAPKSHNGLENKIKNGGVEIYNKNQADNQINALAPYDDIAKSNTKLDNPNSTTNAITKQEAQEIPQNTQSLQPKENTLRHYEALAEESKALDISGFRPQYDKVEANTALTQRANTIPHFQPDEIIDVEFIAQEPNITKRIEYKRHNARAKTIQDLQEQLKSIDAQATQKINNGDSAEFFLKKYQNVESKLKELENKQGIPQTTKAQEIPNIHTLRQNTRTMLKERVNKEIINKNTEEVAVLTNKGIAKMLSDKAVQKSVDNGFTKEAHFKAVEQVESLFANATKATSQIDKADKNLTIHRYNAPFENANALLTLKEYKLNGKKIYSLELENLSAIKFNPSGKDLMEQLPKSKDADTTNFHTPIDNSEPNSTTNQNQNQKWQSFYKENLQRQLETLNANEKYLTGIGKNYDKASFAKTRQDLEQEIQNLKTRDFKDLEINDNDLLFLKEIAKRDKTDNNHTIRALKLKGKDKEWVEKELKRGKELFAQYRKRIEISLNVSPLKEFGTNYAEFYHDGQGAIHKLIAESQDFAKSGEKGEFNAQVAGAFHKEGLGDIDLVWGKVTDKEKHKGYGLAHIIDKHPELDLNLIPEIIEKGKLINNNGVSTIWHKGENGEYYKVGLSKGLNGESENNWLITAYEAVREKDKTFGDALFTDKRPLSNSKTDSTTNPIKEEAIKANNTQEPLEVDLKQRLENAGLKEKTQIIAEELSKQEQKLNDEIERLTKIEKNKEFLPFEIEEKIRELEQNKFYKDFTQEEMKDKAIARLGLELYRQILDLKKQRNKIHSNVISLRGRLERLSNPKYEAGWDYILYHLQQDVTKLEKKVLKGFKDSIKERELTYKIATKEGESRARKLFNSFNPDDEQKELFERILPVAQKLDVEVKQAINNEFLSKQADGVYYTQQNSVRVKNNRISQEKGKVFLHELIHSVTSRAMIAYESGNKQLLKPNQITAMENIQNLYKEVHKNHKDLGFDAYEGFNNGFNGDYGLKNTHEFVAELSNPVFREKLKKVGVFEKLIDNILRLFVSAKDAFLLKRNNAYESLKKNLYTIIDNYSDDFTSAYNKAGVKDVELVQEKLEQIKAKTINAVDSFAKSQRFQNLSKDKQQAILSLKEIEPALMPQNITKQDLDNLINHFNSKQDKETREYYLKLLNDTKENPHIVLETLGKNGEARKEYIKAYQHLENKDLYYIAITQENDKINITAYPTTQVKKVINDIERSKEVSSSGGSLGNATNRQADKVQSPKLVNEIIPQETLDKVKSKFKYDEQKAKDLMQWHKDSSPLTKDEQGLPKVFYHGSGDAFGFEVFKPSAADEVEAIYFSTSKKVAKSYEQMGYTNGGIYKCFLNMKNPLVLDFKNNGYDQMKYAKALNKAKENGNDGVIIKNVFDDTGGYYDSNGTFKDIPSAHTYIVFNPNQIKAVDNIGAYKDSKGEIIGGVENAKEALKEGEVIKDKQESLQTYRTKEEKENFVKNYDFEKGAVEIPKEVNIKEFLESANNFKNKENFIKHLQNKEDSQSRLAYLNLIEPTFKEPNIKLINGERETYIKAFKSGNNIYEMLITQEGGKTLITSIPTTRLAYVKTKIKNADLIQTFTSQDSKDIMPSGLPNPNSTTKNINHSYFNESSPNIYQSNPHIGSGLVGGSVAGVEQDEQGNLTFDPTKFALGFLGGAAGSKAVAKGFGYIKQNPKLKEAVVKELAQSLKLGFEKASQKYPILQTLQPRYIVQNEKGRIAQAKAIVGEIEKKETYQQREHTKELLNALIGKDIVNENDGRVAQVSRKNIAKMTSDKAISKSVANGFSELEHFSAVQDIEKLYKRAVLKETTDDKQGESYLKIHRYCADIDNNTQAKITLKETIEHGNKIYTLELEELNAPKKQVHSQAIGEQFPKSRKPEPMHPDTPLENPNTIIPQETLEAKREVLKRLQNAKEIKARDSEGISSAQSYTLPSTQSNSTKK